MVGGDFVSKSPCLGVFVFNGDEVALVVDAAVCNAKKNFRSWDSLQIYKTLVTHKAFVCCEWNFTIDRHLVAAFMQNTYYFTKVLSFISLKHWCGSLLV